MPEIDIDLCALTDEELISRARLGSNDAFGVVIARHYHKCVNVAASMLHNRSDAADEVQKACCKAYLHLHQYNGDAEFVAWLMSIVSNECRMLIRTRKRATFLYIDARTEYQRSTPIELPATTENPERALMIQEYDEILRREIRCIPPLFRNVLLMHDIQQLPISDVAGRLSITIPAAKSRLLRARIELRERVLKRCGKLLAGRRGSRAQTLPPIAARRISPDREITHDRRVAA